MVYRDQLHALLGALRDVEAATLRDLRTAEEFMIASDGHDETQVQATKALHREVTEAVKELTDAVRAAQRLERVRA